MMDLALVAIFAALIAAVTVWVPGISVPGSTVPITLQTLAVGLAAMVLGPWRGFAATALYVLVGLAGLPVFAQGTAGVGVLAKPSVGYLLSFPLYALLVGALSYAVLRRGLRMAVVGLVVAGLIGSFLLIHPLGIVGLMQNLDIPFGKALKIDMAFWPGDLIKTIVASLIATAVHKAFPALALRPAATVPAERELVA
ncbi:MAG: biotin transporter BioY [Micrococcales bacterium]|nr:biotin transporter BioY [Micrococcales bacterium]